MTKKLMYVGMQFDYGDRNRGFSFEHRNFWHSLKSYAGKLGWEFIHYDFMDRGEVLGVEGMTQELLETARRERPDFLFAVLFDFHRDPLHEVFRLVSESGTRTIHWFCDDHWRFDRYSHIIAPHFDLVCTTAESALPGYRRMGMGERVIKSQWACNHELYVPHRVHRDVPVSFVGQPHGDRRQVIEFLHRRGLDVSIYGYGWENAPRIPFHQMVRLFSRSKINLNLSNASTNGGQQIKGRNFEIPGTGGFLLTGDAENLRDYYEENREIVIFRSLEELADKASWYLDHENEREAIARAGHERTLAEHTWHHRFDTIFARAGAGESPVYPLSTHGSGAPRVSVVMPCYNYGKYFEDSIPTVIAQTFTDWELIIVNDGSTDNSVELAKAATAPYPAHRIRIVTQANGGLMAARNRGIQEARGEYAVFFDPDDRLEPTFIEKTMKTLDEQPDVGFVYTQYKTFGACEQFFPQFPFSVAELKEKCIVTASALFRKKLWQEVGNTNFHRNIVGEDWDFWMSCAELGWRGQLIPEILIHYRRHGDNRTMTAELNQDPLPYLVLRHPWLYGRTTAEKAAAYIMAKDPANIAAPWLTPVLRPLDDGPVKWPFVNITMVTYNRLEFTRQAIDALVAHTDHPYVLTVVDNGSTDGTPDYLRDLKTRGIIKNLELLEENAGVAKAANLGWALEPDAGYYLKLDNDIVIRKPGWLTRMVEALDRVPELGAVACNFEPVTYPVRDINGVLLRVKPEGNLGGACVLIPKRTHERLGFWCEDYAPYGEEDYDYGMRINFSGLINAYMEDEEAGFHLPAGRAARIDMETLSASDGIEEKMHADYRRWKDEMRRRTVQSGTVRRNLEKYLAEPASMHVASPFVEERLKRSEEKRKLRVAVYSLDLEEYACARLRLLSPLKAHKEQVELLWGVGENLVDQVPAMEADLIVIQRGFPRRETADFVNWLYSLEKPVIHELDDLLTDLPAGNPHRAEYGQHRPFIENAVRRANLVTVSTEELKEELLPLNRNIEVLPNILDEELWQGTPEKISAGPVVIGYAGTPTHGCDLGFLEEALRQVAARYGGQVEFVFFGCIPDFAATLPMCRTIPFTTDYESYARLLPTIGLDIAVAPLSDNRFNRCKSNIKWLEYSACGIAGVYADLPPYNSCVRDGETGLLAGKSADAWFEAIDRLVSDAGLRRRIASQARAEVLGSHTLASRAHRYLETWRAVAEGKDIAQRESKPRFSIIILTWNRARMLDKCLSSLFASLSDPGACEIIVGDNGSTDDTKAVLARYPIDRCVRKDRNTGLRLYRELFGLARGEYLIVLDDDVLELPRHFDRAFADTFAAFPDYGYLGLDVVRNELTNGAKPDSSNYRDDIRGGRTVQEGPVVGCCACVPREVFDEIGGFGGYPLGMDHGEDWTLYRQARDKGKRAGIIKDLACLHACGPHYSREYGCLERDVEKYRSAGMMESARAYEEMMTRPAYSVSIIIPVFNKLDYTRQCIEALIAATPAEIGWELIVVDNASTDGTSAWLQSLAGDVKVIANTENLGFARACNQGAAVATGKYLVFLNNDTIPQAGWLEGLIAAAEQDNAQICGARLLYPDGRIQHAGVAFDERGIGYHIFNGFPKDHPAVTKKRVVQCVTAACMLVRQELFQQLGGFDEGYRNGYEDVDLCLRAGQRGCRIVYAPDSALVHFEETSEGRKAHDNENARRFLAAWRGKVRQDDDQLYAEEGYCKKPGPDGKSYLIVPAERRATPPARQETAKAPEREGYMHKEKQNIDILRQTAASALTTLGRALKEEMRYGEAVETLELARKFGEREVLADMGDCQAHEGKIDKAFDLYREALAVDPCDCRSLIGLGTIQILKGNGGDAARRFASVLQGEPANVKALCGLSMARRLEGNVLEAFTCARRALEHDPEYLPALHELIKGAYELNRLAEAEQSLKNYLMYHPADEHMLFSLAGLLYKAGKGDAALDAVERLMVVNPAYEGAAELLARIQGAPSRAVSGW